MKHLKLRSILLAAILCGICVTQASALEYTFDAPEDYLFASPTSQNVIVEQEAVNVDRSKNTALIAPGFGSPTSYLPGSGEYLTPNLVPGALSGGLVNTVSGYSDSSAGSSVSSVGNTSLDPSGYPAVDSGGSFTTETISNSGNTVSFTEVSSDLYYADGCLGTLQIPTLGVDVKVYEGTDSEQLAKGAGHFEDTSIWAGNVCIAGHNRGVNCYFGDIHTLNPGDTITLSTKLGERNYSVVSVEKISETDNTMLAATSENCITLFTCVRNESAYRWCVRAVAEG